MQFDLKDERFEDELDALFDSYQEEQGIRIKRFSKRVARALFAEGVKEFGNEFRQLSSWRVKFALQIGEVTLDSDDRYDSEYLKAHEEEE